jgi:DNA transformation protein and related proteins
VADPRNVALRDTLLDRLAGLAGLRAKGMFGGVGLWAEDGLFFGMVADGRVYFRTDDGTRAAYAAAGSTGLRHGDEVSERYLSVPDAVLADPAALLAWAEDALDATRREQAAKKRR